MHSTRFTLVSILLTAAITFSVSGCGKSPEKTAAKTPANLVATMETDKGTIEFELLPAVAPKTVENFRLLAQRKYYDQGMTIFRVVQKFMIQTGDPQNNGKGGESAWGAPFDDEIEKTSPLYRGGYKRGTVAMANAGRNTNTSQFFIVQQDFPLPPDYTIFGRVTRGMEVVDAIMTLPMERGIDGGMTKPVNPPAIKTITVREVPAKP